MPDLGLEGAENLLWGVSIYVGVVLAAFWLALVVWAYRDIRARSRDGIAQILVALLVLVLNIPGVVVYLLLRPRETLAEAYERSLEEEALLQEIEEKPTCPGCKQRVDDDWQACPHCHTRLKKPCIACKRMLELSWQLCPHCATPQTTSAALDYQAGYTQNRPGSVPEQWMPPRDYRYNNTGSSESLEFIDGDEQDNYGR
jgi:RNA polymerase subunit RPABC4/transcription elongation factor Spt4